MKSTEKKISGREKIIIAAVAIVTAAVVAFVTIFFTTGFFSGNEVPNTNFSEGSTNEMIGIIGAMESEVENLIGMLEEKEVTTISGIDYTRGKLNGRNCVLAVCGVGKTNAAVCAQTMILKFAPVALINTGVAGGIPKEVKVLDLVLSTDTLQYDMDTTAVGDPKGMISGINKIKIDADKNLLNKAVMALEEIGNNNYHLGTIASGDSFIADSEKSNEINREFGAVAVEMEGGSIGQVAYLNKVPFLIVRAISDNANDIAKINYEEFLPLASQANNQLILKLIEKI